MHCHTRCKWGCRNLTLTNSELRASTKARAASVRSSQISWIVDPSVSPMWVTQSFAKNSMSPGAWYIMLTAMCLQALWSGRDVSSVMILLRIRLNISSTVFKSIMDKQSCKRISPKLRSSVSINSSSGLESNESIPCIKARVSREWNVAFSSFSVSWTFFFASNAGCHCYAYHAVPSSLLMTS